MDAHAFDRLSMDGKVAVVTGSTQGLGETIAHLFADRGARGLVITGRNAKNGARVKAELEKKGNKLVWEVEVITAENKVMEVHIDADTGVVIDVEEEKAKATKSPKMK